MYRLFLVHQGDTFIQKIGNKVLATYAGIDPFCTHHSQEYEAVKDLSILAQAPSYFLIGAGEVLTSISGTSETPEESILPVRNRVCLLTSTTNDEIDRHGHFLPHAGVGILPWLSPYVCMLDL